MANVAADQHELMPGMVAWTNPGNGFRIIKLHYTADPKKRAPSWKASAKEGMPEQGWQREYELSFEAPLGQAVIPEFSAENIKPNLKATQARILRGWDFGQVSPAVVFGQVDLHGRKLFLGELVLSHITIGSLVDAVKARTMDLFGRPEPCFDAGDPAGDSLQDLGQLRAVLHKHGIFLRTGRTDDSYDNLRKEFLRRVVVPGEGVTPAILIHPRCVTLIEALQGAFHYPQRPTLKDPKPSPDHPYKDIVDAMRYLNDNLQLAATDLDAQWKKIASQDIVWE